MGTNLATGAGLVPGNVPRNGEGGSIARWIGGSV